MFRKVIVVVALLVVLTPGDAFAVQYPPTTTPTTSPPTTCPECPPPTTPTTQPGGTTTTSTVLVGPDEPNGGQPRTRPPDGALPRTGADTIALLVRIGVVLLVAGFVLYLAGRNRRAARADDDLGLGTA